MNSHKKLFSIIIIITILITSFPIASAASEDYKPDGVFLFGSYPQSEVKDAELLASLNSIESDWKSYGYYCGTGKWNDGKMHSSDYMRYMDVRFNGNQYRAVTFDSYRPYFSGFETTAEGDSYQDNNGYECGKVYWFKFEPLRWHIVDKESGYALCETIIDSQPFQNMIYYNGWEYFADDNYYDHSNYYVVSSIRNMLNNEFLNCAFLSEEKENLDSKYMDDMWKPIEDKVFLPSANEMKNENVLKNTQERIAVGTDYAKCQGLFTDAGNSYWYLRSPGDNSYTSFCVSTDGSLYGKDYYLNRYSFFTSFTGTGIRPAIKIKDFDSAGVKFSEETSLQPNVPKEEKMSFFKKIGSFFKNIFGITGYFLKRPDNDNEKAADVISSLGRGINMPCMESGWARDYIMEKETFDNVKNKGFDFIRLPANLAGMLDYDGRLNESAMKNLDTVIDFAVDSELSVLLDLHGWEELNNDPSAQNVEKLISIWSQISERYVDYSEKLCFEIYNEPNNSSGKMSDIRWNYIQLSVVSAIRKIDPDRIIALSPKNYNDAGRLSAMAFKCADKYVFADVHNYSPMEFTHQGAEWIPGVYEEKIPFSQDMLDKFEAPLKEAAKFQKKTGIRIVLGEFGVYQKQTSQDDVSQFLSGAVGLMKKYDIPWGYWEYNAGFGAYDYQKKEWKPFVADALMS